MNNVSAIQTQLYDRFGNKKLVQSVLAQGGEGQICTVAHGKHLILCKLFFKEEDIRVRYCLDLCWY